MTVVLFLLKIVGVVILAVLGVVLLVLVAVLFVPFRYRICANLGSDEAVDNKSQEQDTGDEVDGREGNSDKMQANVLARVHWLLHFLGIEVSYRDGRLDAYLRILFWRKKLLNNEEAQEDEDNFKEDAKETAKEVAQEAVKPPEEAARSSDDTESESQGEADKIQSATDSLSERHPQAESKEVSEIKEKESSGTRENETSKTKETVDTGQGENPDGIIARIKKLWNDFSNFRRKLTRMVEDERNRRAVSHLKAELIRLLQAIRPRKLAIDLEFSLGSPDLTGEVLGVCAWFPIFYQSGNHLTPDFEADAAYAKGNVDAKGRIYLFQILFAALRILFDKDCKRMYRMFKKYFG